jgi:hypothetical protein
MYSDNPVLSDDIQHNKYYGEYKKSDAKTNTTTNSKNKLNSSNKKNTDTVHLNPNPIYYNGGIFDK